MTIMTYAQSYSIKMTYLATCHNNWTYHWKHSKYGTFTVIYRTIK